MNIKMNQFFKLLFMDPPKKIPSY